VLLLLLLLGQLSDTNIYPVTVCWLTKWRSCGQDTPCHMLLLLLLLLLL
jgi:hypothetical protein